MYPVFLDKPAVIKTAVPQKVYETITIDDDDDSPATPIDVGVAPGVSIHAQTSCSKYGLLYKLYFTI